MCDVEINSLLHIFFLQGLGWGYLVVSKLLHITYYEYNFQIISLFELPYLSVIYEN